MATIPTLQRQQRLPKQSGVGSQPQVLIQDNSGQAMQQVGQTFGAISENLFAAQAKDHVTQATLNSTLKLNQLTTDLAKEDPATALSTYKDKSDAVYSDVASGMSVAAREAFNSQWATMSAQAQINVQASAIKRGKQQVLGNLDTALDGFGRGVAIDGSEITLLMAEREGVKAIQNAITHNIIDADDGAKRIIKFRSDIAKNAITGWIGRTPKARLMEVYDQLNSGDFSDTMEGLTLSRHWKQLDNNERLTELNKLSRHMRDLQSKEDKIDKEQEDAAKLVREQTAGKLFAQIVAVQREERNAEALPTPELLREMMERREIEPSDQIMLTKKLLSLEDPETSPVDLLDLRESIYALDNVAEKDRPAEAKKILSRLKSLAADNRLEDSHAASLSGLLDKVQQRGFKNSTQKRARVSLKRLLGAQDPEFQIANINEDPQRGARVQNALNEYDARIDEMATTGETPWEIHQDLLERSTIELPDLKSFVRPKFSNQTRVEDFESKDVTETQLRTVAAFRKGEIKKGAFNREMERLSRIAAILAQTKSNDDAKKKVDGKSGGKKSDDDELERRKK